MPQVEIRPHPRGEAGTRISIEEAAKRAAAARLDPRVRAWAIEKIVQAGNPKGVVDRAQVLLEALRRERIYIEDPTDSDFMPSAACTLVGCQGLMFLGEDCDGLLIAWLGACGSIGIFGAVIGHSYEPTGQLSHVLGAIWDGTSQWYKADPSTKQAFGTVSSPTRERWVAVHDGRTLCDRKYGCDPKHVEAPMAKMRKASEFVGVLGAPMSNGHAGEPEPLSSNDFFVGGPADQSAMASEIKVDHQALLAGYKESLIEHEKIVLLREYLNKPMVDMDLVQAGSVNGPGDPVLSPDELWSGADEAKYQQSIKNTEVVLQYGFEAITGNRPMARNVKTMEITILAKPGEKYVEPDGKGDLTSGTIPGSSQSGTLGWGPVVVIVAKAVMVVAITAAAYGIAHVAMTGYREHMKVVMVRELRATYNNAIANGMTPQQAAEHTNKVQAGINEQARINVEGDDKNPLNKLISALETVMVVGLGVGVVVAGGYLLTQLIPMFKSMKKSGAEA